VTCWTKTRRSDSQNPTLTSSEAGFVTLVEPNDTHKYWHQRFISRGAYEFFERFNEARRHGHGKAAACIQAGAPKGSFASLLSHEHVVECNYLIGQLLEATSPASVDQTLDLAAACVVTREEHKRLASNAVGWERYRRAQPPVEVWDRLDSAWIVGETALAPRAGGIE
jgi:hypothetical protein